MPKALLWLLTEGMLPLIGANLIFLGLGAGRRISFNKKGKTFKWAWGEAVIRQGWLYGTTLLAVQLGRAAWSSNGTLAAFFFVAVALCLFLLISPPCWTGEKTIGHSTSGSSPPAS